MRRLRSSSAGRALDGPSPRWEEPPRGGGRYWSLPGVLLLDARELGPRFHDVMLASHACMAR